MIIWEEGDRKAHGHNRASMDRTVRKGTECLRPTEVTPFVQREIYSQFQERGNFSDSMGEHGIKGFIL